MQGVNLEAFDPTSKVKNKIGKDQEQNLKPKEGERSEEAFKKVFSQMIDKQDATSSSAGLQDVQSLGSNKVVPSAYNSKKLSEHIQMSDHPGRFAMMKQIDPENYEKGFEAFKQITASEFDPDKLPKPETSQLGMRSLVVEIGLGVVG